MTLEIRVSPWDALVTQRQASKVLETYPNLARHVCVNEHGNTFGDDIAGTWPAHLLEHLAIELMAQAHGSGEGLMGHTQLTDEKGLAITKLTFKDDIVALRCVKDAVAVINGL